MSKFKVGDVARVVSLTTQGYLGAKRVGDLGTVTEVFNEGFSYKLDYEVGSCYLSTGDLERAYPNPPHKHAELIKAWADGAELQFKNNIDSVPEWRDYTPKATPTWNYTHLEFRIKPQKTDKGIKLEELETQARKLADEIKELRDA